VVCMIFTAHANHHCATNIKVRGQGICYALHGGW
jgi:hypothetical protein